jgi:hypothetical protein
MHSRRCPQFDLAWQFFQDVHHLRMRQETGEGRRPPPQPPQCQNSLMLLGVCAPPEPPGRGGDIDAPFMPPPDLDRIMEPFNKPPSRSLFRNVQ